MLAKAIVQFLSQSLLLPVVDGENFSFKSFAPLYLAFQFFVCHKQLMCSLASAVLVDFVSLLRRGFRLLLLCDVAQRADGVERGSVRIANDRAQYLSPDDR